jgi:hypothetical protein
VPDYDVIVVGARARFQRRQGTSGEAEAAAVLDTDCASGRRAALPDGCFREEDRRDRPDLPHATGGDAQ